MKNKPNYRLQLGYAALIALTWASPCLGGAVPATVPVPTPVMFADLARIARASLSANLVRLQGGTYMRAGSHQFQAIWTRDFCWSVRGLLAMGRADVVRDTLALLIANRRPADEMVPRLMDSTTITERYLFKIFRINPKLHDPLRAEFNGGNKAAMSIDSNMLVVLGSLFYLERTGDQAFWDQHAGELARIFAIYDQHMQGGLIYQPPYADWQDNVAREGRTLYTNVIYWALLERLIDHRYFGVTQARADALKAKILEVFYDPATGLLRSIEGYPYMSTDGIALAFEFHLLGAGSRQERAMYDALKRHPLWTANGGIPGFWGYPDYPREWSAWVVNLVGLQHYSDSLYTPTLMAWLAKLARRMGDAAEADRMLTRMEGLAVRDGAIEELYEFNPGLQHFESWFYRSEHPFSFSSAAILETLAEIPPRPAAIAGH